MRKFLVTLVTGKRVLCYVAEAEQVTNYCAVKVSLFDPKPVTHAARGLWACGVSSVGHDLPAALADRYIDLPRCYLNTEAGRQRLQLEALLAIRERELKRP